MCVSSTPSAPVAKTSYRDTSQDPIISNYELSDAQKAENKRRRAAKRSKSLVSFSDNGGTGTGVSFSGSAPSSRGFSTEQATGFGMDL